MHLLRQILWIAAAALAIADWVMKERWLGEFWRVAFAASVVALVAVAVWIVFDWRRSRD